MKGAVTVGAFGILPMATAGAATTVEQATNACTTGALVICLSFSLQNTSGNNYSLELTLNTINGAAPGGAGFSSFGLVGSGANGTFVGVDPGPGGWDFTGCSDLNPLTALICANKNGAKATDRTFTFTYSGSSSDLAGLDVIAHIQNIAAIGGCSAKTDTHVTPGTTGSSSFYTTPGAGEEGCTSVTTTPEPASLFLVGSGLLGLGGFGAVRRRRSKA